MNKPLTLIIEDNPQSNEIMALTLEVDFEINSCTAGITGWSRLNEIVPHNYCARSPYTRHARAEYSGKVARRQAPQGHTCDPYNNG